MSLLIDQRVVYGGDRVLPDQLFLRHERAQVARARTHVAVRQLEPRPRKGVGELVRVLLEAPRDLLVDRIEPQGKVRRQHRRRVALRRVNASGTVPAPALPFGFHWYAPAGLFGQLPFVAEQVLEEVVAPLGRRSGPRDFEAAADGVFANAGAEAALPAQSLLLDRSGFGFRANMGGRRCAVRLAEGVAAGNQRHGLFVIHRHARKGFADVGIAAIGSGLRLGPSGLT